MLPWKLDIQKVVYNKESEKKSAICVGANPAPRLTLASNLREFSLMALYIYTEMQDTDMWGLVGKMRSNLS